MNYQILDVTTGTAFVPAKLYTYFLDNSPEIDSKRTRPAIVLCPGGGYRFTSDREAEAVAMQFLAAGIHVAILRYTVAPQGEYPQALREVAWSVAHIREHAAQYHVDPDRILVMGFSAGGHLAANLATSVGDEDIREQGGMDPDAVRPNALMLSYPVITAGKYAHRGSFQCLLGDQAHNQALLDKFSIEKHIDAKTPPVFVWHTMTDDAVPVENTLMLIQACRAAGLSIEAHLFPEGSHGLSLANAETAGNGFYAHIVECVQCWPDLAEAWLRRLF